jgi:hypothetical protein
MSPLRPAIVALRDAEMRRSAAVRDAAQLWTDGVFRALDMRVLEPLAVETRRFSAGIEAADAALARALRLLDEH